MYDHIGGGFARYSTDRQWLVPHFEKMLYDNALLARSYLEGFQVTGEESYRRVATEILDYVLREMTSPEGGFYSSTDADSEGEEGKYFVWMPEEIEGVLGEADARQFNAYYDITSGGNWEGKNIPNTPRSLQDVARQFDLDPKDLAARLADWRSRVYEVRSKRVKPGLDDKVLTAWNGLMVSAMANGYRVLRDIRYLDGARRAADFILRTLRREDGALLRTYRDGKAHLSAYLEDYAFLAEGLIDLYEAGGDQQYLREAENVLERVLTDFGGEDDAQVRGAFYNTSVDHERLLIRYRDGSDGATPSANAVAAAALARLSYHLDRADFRDAAIDAIKAYGRMIAKFPRAFAKSLSVVSFLLEGPVELAFVGRRGAADLEALRRETARHYLPNRIEAVGYVDVAGTEDVSASSTADAAAAPLLRGKSLVNDHAALYICRDFTCEAPVTDPAQLADALAARPRSAEGHTIAMPLAGQASLDAGYRRLGTTQLTVSLVGFGGYRVDDETPEHREALTRALLSGVNLIDTSANYTDGASERLVGSVVKKLVAEQKLERDEVVIVSKIGYVQGINYRLAREREARGTPFPQMVKMHEGLWHSIHPAFIDDQLQRCLDRLELEALDACLLHNPEYFLIDAAKQGMALPDAQAEFYARLESAFRFLEEQVQKGRLGCYGVSSNTVVSSALEPAATSLPRILEAAQRAVGEGAEHHFRVVQFPLNLFEAGALLGHEDGVEASAAALDVARSHDSSGGGAG
jgi:aryl-alcohol dehydrogenase-like predicted oxidoreductase